MVINRSLVSPASRAWRAWPSRQTPHPLIWLARKFTRPTVVSEMPLEAIAAPRPCRAARASGMAIAGWVIRGSMMISLSHRCWLVRQCCDGSRRGNVTMTEEELLAERFEADRVHLSAVAYRMLGSTAEAED